MIERIRLEKPEAEKFNPDLIVDLIRHGKAVYSAEENETFEFEGKLNEEGKEQAERVAEELVGKIDKENDLVVIWSSPKNRARETATILGRVFQERKINVIKGLEGASAKEALRDVKISKDLMVEAIADKISFSDWMSYWSEKEDLPAGTESPAEVKKRVERIVTYLERIARTIKPATGKKLRFVCVGHEEIFRDLLEEGYGIGTKKGESPANGEVMSLDIQKSTSDAPAVIGLRYRGNESRLDFDPRQRKFRKADTKETA